MKVEDGDDGSGGGDYDDFEEFPLAAPIHRSLGIDPLNPSCPQHLLPLILLLVKYRCIGCLRAVVMVMWIILNLNTHSI